MKRKIFSLFLVAVSAIFFFTGCAKKSDKKIKIGVSLASFNDTFILSLKNDIDSYVKSTYSDEVELVFADAEDDYKIQFGQVENFITQEVDAVIIVPVNTDDTAPITSICEEAETSVVYLNRKPRKLGAYALYIGSDEKEAGKLQGEYIAKLLNGKGNIAILMGPLDMEATFRRTEGVEEIIENYPDMKIVKKQTGNWKKSLSKYIIKNWFDNDNEIDAIISNNDSMAIGAIRYLESTGKFNETKVVGIDATREAVAELESGAMSATVFQNSKKQAKAALDKTVKTVKGKKVKQITWIPFQLVTKETYGGIVIR